MKYILTLALLAAAGGLTAGAAQAGPALRDRVVSTYASSAGALSCQQCYLRYRTPKPGETVTLNPQPLPPRYATGLLRR